MTLAFISGLLLGASLGLMISARFITKDDYNRGYGDAMQDATERANGRFTPRYLAVLGLSHISESGK